MKDGIVQVYMCFSRVRNTFHEPADQPIRASSQLETDVRSRTESDKPNDVELSPLALVPRTLSRSAIR
jgi:hypothetical protein